MESLFGWDCPCDCIMNLQDVYGEMFNYIEGYRSPIDFENQYYQTILSTSHK